MSFDAIDDLVRQAIGGDTAAVRRIIDASGDAVSSPILVMAAVLNVDATLLDRAATFAATSRDRQVIDIARAHLAGDHDHVDALARDHLVDHPGSLLVAWLASGQAPGSAS